MKALLFGGSGMLAADIIATAPPNTVVVALDRARCDVTDEAAVRRAIDAERPDLLINASAYTAVDRAESEPQIANAVNGSAVGVLGAVARAHSIAIVHFSTDYVFSGTQRVPYAEDAPTSPVNAYGASKLLGERLLAESGARALVIRTQWMFGHNGRSFARTMLDRARACLTTRVVDDQWGAPTYTVDLARASWSLVAHGASGTVHAVNAGEPATWYSFAKHIFSAVGAGQLVSPCSTSEYPTPAKRPAYSVLSAARLERLTGAPLPCWTGAVDRFLAKARR